eukprot:TRINITY_DN52129_c0_g1_i1.p1 TRINITY_DN52129_c0_g1~~TRINITY_DN52129_c0_g1_i1.p1  ORF type:complete len:564 (-),score=29.24 TRINITY_DN52129_c0_g1_i1:288-1979(-)
MFGLEDLTPENKLTVLRCICAASETLPSKPLRALASASSEWRRLSAAHEILPFLSKLHCKLLTPGGPCKRSGDAWHPEAPLQAHRRQDSQPLPEVDELIAFLRCCQRRHFEPVMDFIRAGVNTVEQIQRFREAHFAEQRGHAEPDPYGESPPPVWCAAACALPNRKVCVVGGGVYSFERTNANTDWCEVFWHQPEVFVFDLATGLWTKQQVSGTPPPPAHTNATAHTLLGSRWTFWCGGYYGEAYNTAYALDVESWEWRELRNSSTCSPSPRYFTASFGYRGALYAWGGRGREHVYFKDLWRLDPSRAHQDVVHCEEVAATGELPPAKFGATLTNCDDEFAVLFGGAQWKVGGAFDSDVETFTLELKSMVWTRLLMSGPAPNPRCQHSAVNLGGNFVLVLGGYDGTTKRYMGSGDICVLNARSLRWMDLRVAQDQSRTEDTHYRVDPDSDEDVASETGSDSDESIADATDDEARRRRARRRIPHVSKMCRPFSEHVSSRGIPWLCGDFPCSRAGIAIADASRVSSDSKKSFFLFGGAEYVHQEWFSDLYECSLHSAVEYSWQG